MVCKVVFGAIVFLLLVSLALLPTVGRGGLVAMASLCLLALGLPIFSIAARRPRAPRAPVPVHWGLVRLYPFPAGQETVVIFGCVAVEFDEHHIFLALHLLWMDIATHLF